MCRPSWISRLLLLVWHLPHPHPRSTILQTKSTVVWFTFFSNTWKRPKGSLEERLSSWSIKEIQGYYQNMPKTSLPLPSYFHQWLWGEVLSRRCNCGRKKRPEADFSCIKDVPLSKRKSLWALSEAVNTMSRSNLQHALRDGKIKTQNSQMRPHLTLGNRLHRIDFVLNQIDKDKMMNNFKQCIHIDKKLFYLTKTSQKFYLLLEEEAPHH